MANRSRPPRSYSKCPSWVKGSRRWMPNSGPLEVVLSQSSQLSYHHPWPRSAVACKSGHRSEKADCSRGPRPHKQGFHILGPRPNMRGIPEIMVRRILLFMFWGPVFVVPSNRTASAPSQRVSKICVPRNVNTHAIAIIH